MLIVGLGNPGARYAATRHNIGFAVVAALAAVRGWEWQLVCRALVAEGPVAEGPVAEGPVAEGPVAEGSAQRPVVEQPTKTETAGVESLPAGRLSFACPQTFMNRSGLSVRCLAERSQLDRSRILVVYDEVALPFGTLRMRPSGSAAGHHGLESILTQLQSDEVARLRIGVAPLDETPVLSSELSDFVLSPFSPMEEHRLSEVVSRAAAAVNCWIQEGTERAMNRFNGPLPVAGGDADADSPRRS